MKTYKTAFTACMAFFFVTGLNAQSWLKTNNMLSTQANHNHKENFYDLQSKFNDYFKGKNMDQDEVEGSEDEGWHQFKRWEYFMEQRVYPSGEFPQSDILWTEFQKYKNEHQNANKTNVAPTWVAVGPTVVPSNGGGAGRINCLAFLPGNPNTMFLGTACGGIWKSTNGGTSWAALNTDLLPSMSISDICIDPNNTNIIYIATGDNYGIYYQYSTDGHYSNGVMKSVDGGLTWNSTGMIYTQNQQTILQKMIIHPTVTNLLLVTTSTGIFRSTNSGTSWTNVQAGNFYSIEYNPLKPSVMYAASGLDSWRSNNNGLTWTKQTTNLHTTDDRQTIKNTAADTSVLYSWGTSGMRRSANGGATWTNITATNCGGYGYYDRAIVVNPTNANDLYTGGLNISRSTNGGTSHTVVSAWSPYTASNYCHADQKRLYYAPGSSTTIYAVNDGGVFRSTTGGTTWTDLSNTLQIGQFYRIASAATNANIIYFGAQDNGSSRGNAGVYTQVYGADGMQPLVDYTNDQIVFVSSQSGGVRKSTNGGATFNACAPSGGAWVTPYLMHLTNPQIMYFGGSTGVYKSTTGGGNGTWTKVSGSTIGTVIALAISKSNGQVVYAAEYGKLFKTTDGGSTWTDITGTLPVGSASITYVAVSGSDANRVYVTFSGYSAGNKVFTSSNGGTTWTNFSGTLPNIPANTICYENGSWDQVYVGTDFGVFYRNASMVDWLPYNTGLPNVMIDHLEIHYGANKLRAGTYGRGIWQVDLSPTTGIPVGCKANTSLNVYPNPSSGSFNISFSLVSDNQVTVGAYNMVGEKVKELKADAYSGFNEFRMDLSGLSNGVYLIKVESQEGLMVKKVTLENN